MKDIKVLGVDLAKDVFQLHGTDAKGNKRLSRRKLIEYMANITPCLVGIEACGGAHYWARVFQKYGHVVRLISPQFVKPFVKTNKNYANDAEAMVEAASRPSMHYVPIKQVVQQDIQSIHRARSRLVKNRTALINEIRGLNLEYGIALPQGASKVKNLLIDVIGDKDNEMTSLSRELYDELLALEKRIKTIEQKIKCICKENDQCQRLLSIPGIGELTATALVAAVPNANEFKNGRHMVAWLGLVPRQSSSGNKQVLLGIRG